MEAFRVYACARCQSSAQICSKCDRGQRYCSKECSSMARRTTQRAAGRRYQRTLKGRLSHRSRQHRYRLRLAQVTHQGSQHTIQVVDSSTFAKKQMPLTASSKQLNAGCCNYCDKHGNGWIRLGYLRRRAKRPKRRRRAQKRRMLI